MPEPFEYRKEFLESENIRDLGGKAYHIHIVFRVFRGLFEERAILAVDEVREGIFQTEVMADSTCRCALLFPHWLFGHEWGSLMIWRTLEFDLDAELLADNLSPVFKAFEAMIRDGLLVEQGFYVPGDVGKGGGVARQSFFDSGEPCVDGFEFGFEESSDVLDGDVGHVR